jgi:hypothetical protein
MRIHLFFLLLVLSLVAACDDVLTAESVGVVQQELTYRYCTSDYNCAAGCDCVSNQCVPDGFGPANPDCGVRLCSDEYDCAMGCNCDGFKCVPDGFGPPNEDCSDPNQPSKPPPPSCDSCPSGQSCHCGDFCWPIWYECP